MDSIRTAEVAMLRTKICEVLRIEYPVISAGMGAVALAGLAAAVSEAGGLGTLSLAGFTPKGIRQEISAVRSLTNKPLAVNLLIPFMRDEQLKAVADSEVGAVTFFWGDPLEHSGAIKLIRNSGAKVIWQCGSVEEARHAKAAGVDVIMAQGVEAGGHVRGNVATFVLIPAVRDAIGDMPLIAAGGIADGRGLAAALALGADGAAFGTRFIASAECCAHPRYKQRILEASATDTVHTTLFDREWPDAPIRVLRTKIVEEWERAGRPAPGERPGEGQTIGQLNRAEIEFGPQFFKYGGIPPADYVEGDIESFPFAAGQSISLIHEVLPAGEIVRRIVAEASAVIRNQFDVLVR